MSHRIIERRDFLRQAARAAVAAPFVLSSWPDPILGKNRGSKRRLTGKNETIPGDVRTPYPTIHNLAVEWLIDGDDNMNSVVTVRYRAVGTTLWRAAMPLRRVPAGENRGNSFFFSWENKHSGSIFDLEPDTEYEIALRLFDPDGGSAETTVRARTRPIPDAMPGASIVRVNPETFTDAAAHAGPGDVLLLSPGSYGFFHAPRDGKPGKPIVFRADPDGRFHFQQTHRGDVLFDGISLQNRKHVYLEGLVSSDTIDLFNAEACVVRRCRVYAAFGIISSYTGNLARKWAPRVAERLDPPASPDRWNNVNGSRREIPPHVRNCYIADNVVSGMTEWSEGALAYTGKNIGEGIQISGPGNVVCHNRVRGFRDAISTLEGRNAVEQVCIDIYNNDISVGPDDGIEADFCMGNCRIMCNRITNCYNGLSSQPGLGGPTYFIRNVMYNVISSTYKFMRDTTGDVVLHNTVVKTGDGHSNRTRREIRHAYFRNNLSIGGKGVAQFGVMPGESPITNGDGLAVYFPSLGSTCDSDYNGYGTVGMPFRGDIGGSRFEGQTGLTRLERHSVKVDLDVFAAPVEFPDPALQERAAPDLRLESGSAATDAGELIPNINDDFMGEAPDLGAYEVGTELPVYGPRPESKD